MSNYSTNSAGLEVTNDEMKEMLAGNEAGTNAQNDADATASVGEISPKKKKNIAYRILALVLAAAPIVCICLLSVCLILNNAGYVIYDKKTFLDAFIAMFSKDGVTKFYTDAGFTVAAGSSFKWMGLPMLSGVGTIGKFTSLVLYAMGAAAILTVVFAIIALCSGKAAPAMTRAIAFVNFWAYTGYALCTIAVAAYYGLKIPVDVVIIAIAGVSFLFYFILSCFKAGKHAWMTLLLFLLSVVFAGSIIYGICNCSHTSLNVLFASTESSFISSLAKGDLYKYATFAIIIISVLAMVISSVRVATKKGYTFDLVRYIVHFLLAGFMIYAAFAEDAFKDFQLFAAIAAAATLVQIILVIVAITAKKRAKKAAALQTEEEAAEQPATEETAVIATENATETEEPAATEETAAEESVVDPIKEAAKEVEAGVYAEAVRYDGYPVETVKEAESLEQPEAAAAETASQQPAVYNYNFHTAPETTEQPATQTAGYDFYNSRSFDPFIASLNNEEREQFTDIFILKYQGETKNLPDYQVGGDNTEFFRKVFIYLGQYRDRIPDSLLAKMYQFAVKK